MVTNPHNPPQAALRCRCCGGPVTIERYRDESLRAEGFRLRHRAAQFHRPVVVPVGAKLVNASMFAPAQTEEVRTPELYRFFLVDDFETEYTAPRLGKLIDAQVQETMASFEGQCRTAIQAPKPTPISDWADFASAQLGTPWLTAPTAHDPSPYSAAAVAAVLDASRPKPVITPPTPEPQIRFGRTKRRIAL